MGAKPMLLTDNPPDERELGRDFFIYATEFEYAPEVIGRQFSGATQRAVSEHIPDWKKGSE